VSFEQRQVVNYFSTGLIVAASITDTTMRATAFTQLDTTTGAKYQALVLHDDALGVFEIVWVSNHSAASDTVTVVRGKEGTTARAWPAGTRVEIAPTAYDALLAAVTSSLPTDAFIGQRAMLGDKFTAVERVNGYWGPSVGVGIAADQGPNMHGTQAPNSAAFLMRSGSGLATTNGSGMLTVNYATAFPTNTQHVSVSSTFINGGGNFAIGAVRANGFDFYVLADSAGGRKANFQTSFTYAAFGW
jgi:hypothetical protein